MSEALRLAEKLHYVSTICDHHYSLDRSAASELERLHAENERLREALQWRPIETAPKDKPIIGFWPSLIESDPAKGIVGVCQAHKWYWVIEVFGEQHECATPTRWMPLPNAT